MGVLRNKSTIFSSFYECMHFNNVCNILIINQCCLVYSREQFVHINVVFSAHIYAVFSALIYVGFRAHMYVVFSAHIYVVFSFVLTEYQ